MRRRAFLLGAAAAPFAVHAQRKPRRVSLFSAGDAAHWTFLGDAMDGSGVRFDSHSAEGRFDRLDKIALDIARLRPDLIVAHDTAAVVAAQKATARIPIVMAVAAEPVRAANVTGLTANGVEVSARVLQLVRDLKSNARRVAMLAHADDPSTRVVLGAFHQAAARMRLTVGLARVRNAADYDSAFAEWDRLRLQALIVQPTVDKARAAALALRYRLPAISLGPGFVELGGLASYSENPRELGRQAASYVDRILKGAKPADLPVRSLTKYDLAVNLKTAKAIDVELPDSVLGRADAILQ